MILLDTDHLTVLLFPEDSKHSQLRNRMQSATDQKFATTIVNVEEQMRGWLALIHRQRDFAAQIPVYERLQMMLEFFAEWTIVPFDAAAVHECQGLGKQRIRIGTKDLKIAAIALANNARLLSANLRDFRKVPRLQTENWLE